MHARPHDRCVHKCGAYTHTHVCTCVHMHACTYACIHMHTRVSCLEPVFVPIANGAFLCHSDIRKLIHHLPWVPDRIVPILILSRNQGMDYGLLKVEFVPEFLELYCFPFSESSFGREFRDQACLPLQVNLSLQPAAWATAGAS